LIDRHLSNQELRLIGESIDRGDIWRDDIEESYFTESSIDSMRRLLESPRFTGDSIS